MSAHPPVTLLQPDPVCGNCAYGPRINVGTIECWGAPPVPVITGVSPAGPMVSVLRPNMPASTPPCALWKRHVGEPLYIGAKKASAILGAN